MQAEKNNKLSFNFISLGFVQVVNLALQLLVIPYVIKIIGAEGFGVIAVAQVVMIFLSTFTDFGFYQTAIRKLALHDNDLESVSKNFSVVFITRIILCVIAFVLLLILLLVVPVFRAHLLLYLMAFAFVIGQSVLMNWFFQGLEKMWFIALTTLAGRILFVVLVFLFIKNNEDDFLFLFFMGIGNILSGFLGARIIFRVFKIRFRRTGLDDVRKELKEGWHYMITNLSMNTCQYANIFILRFFTNDLIVGYFSIAEKIYMAVKQLLIIFSQGIYPGICRLFEKGTQNLIAFFKKVYLPFLFLIVTISIVLIMLAPQVLNIFSGSEAVHSVFILRMLCVALVIVCLNIPFTLTLLAANKRKTYFRIYLAGGVLNILSNILLAWLFQSNGTIAAIFITEVFITAGVIAGIRGLNSTQQLI